MTASELRAHFGPFSVAFTKSQGDGINLAETAAWLESRKVRVVGEVARVWLAAPSVSAACRRSTCRKMRMAME